MNQEIKRCAWAQQHELLRQYHDNEWGKPSKDDRHLFEMLVLEAMQAGLSWLLVLKKREAMAQAFYEFDYHKLSECGTKQIQQWLDNPELIRNRLKLNAVIVNAQCFKLIQQEFGSFSKYLWQWTNDKPIRNHFSDPSEVPSQNKLSLLISKDLKKRGFKFMGPVVVYSYLQAVGVINDHLSDCSFA